MSTFSFTLEVEDPHGRSQEELAEALYEAGCDDALVHWNGGRIFVDFDRDAEDMQDALQTGARDIGHADCVLLSSKWEEAQYMVARLRITRAAGQLNPFARVPTGSAEHTIQTSARAANPRKQPPVERIVLSAY